MTTHSMVSVKRLPHGWIAECLQCERRVIFSRDALHEGRLDQAETVLIAGDHTACHAWSTRADLRIGTPTIEDVA